MSHTYSPIRMHAHLSLGGGTIALWREGLEHLIHNGIPIDAQIEQPTPFDINVTWLRTESE